jgi:pyrroline-5-carboxylate reductase
MQLMLKDKKISIIGTGNMGEALVSGLISSGSSLPEKIICTDIRLNKLKSVKKKYGVMTLTDNIKAVKSSEIIIYAIKPQIISSVFKETAPFLDMSKLIISIAAGVPLSAIETCLKKELRLIRVMPNVAAFVKESASVISSGANATKEDIDLCSAIFNSMGKSIFIKEDALMDAITGLSGSGPAYIFIIVDALADAGVKMGLSREDALFLSTQTVLGAAKLLLETKEHPGRLKDMVTSPGGTTIAGIHALETGGLRATLINAVEAATRRSKELGEIVKKNFAGGGS